MMFFPSLNTWQVLEWGEALKSDVFSPTLLWIMQETFLMNADWKLSCGLKLFVLTTSPSQQESTF